MEAKTPASDGRGFMHLPLCYCTRVNSSVPFPER